MGQSSKIYVYLWLGPIEWSHRESNKHVASFLPVACQAPEGMGRTCNCHIRTPTVEITLLSTIRPNGIIEISLHVLKCMSCLLVAWWLCCCCSLFCGYRFVFCILTTHSSFFLACISVFINYEVPGTPPIEDKAVIVMILQFATFSI